MKYIERAGCEVTNAESMKSNSRPKEAQGGRFIGSVSRVCQVRNVPCCSFVLRSSPDGLPTLGFFTSSRCYGRDSTAPLRPAIDRGGFGICESLSQLGNYSEIIRLARRNHKPWGADLAGSVHVVRSLSG